MPGRHLRRSPGWWLRRAAVTVAVAVVGALVGAGGWLLLDGSDDDPVTAAGSGTAALVPEPAPVTLVVAGELRAGGALAARLDGPTVVGGFDEVLSEADVAVVGLSGAVVDEVPPEPGGAAWVPASILEVLEEAGVDVVSLASDQALDLGPEALAGIVAAGASVRIDLVGVGADEDQAYAPAVREVAGVRVAVLGATQELLPERIATDTARRDAPGVASAKRVDRLVAEVEAAAAAADVVVVHVHWGEPGQTCPSASQQELAAALVAAGADVVAGSGTGTTQGAGRLGDAVVAYGLGALVADGAAEGAALAVQVDGDGVVGWRWVPGRITEGVAEPADAVPEDLAARQACAALTP